MGGGEEGGGEEEGKGAAATSTEFPTSYRPTDIGPALLRRSSSCTTSPPPRFSIHDSPSSNPRRVRDWRADRSRRGSLLGEKGEISKDHRFEFEIFIKDKSFLKKG